MVSLRLIYEKTVRLVPNSGQHLDVDAVGPVG